VVSFSPSILRQPRGQTGRGVASTFALQPIFTVQSFFSVAPAALSGDDGGGSNIPGFARAETERLFSGRQPLIRKPALSALRFRAFGSIPVKHVRESPQRAGVDGWRKDAAAIAQPAAMAAITSGIVTSCLRLLPRWITATGKPCTACFDYCGWPDLQLIPALVGSLSAAFHHPPQLRGTWR